MSREPTTITVDAVEYQLSLLPSSKALDVFIDIVKVAGPTIGPVIGSFLAGGKKGLEVDVSEIKLEDAVKGFTDSLNKDTLKTIMKMFAEHTIVVGSGPLNKLYEMHFAQQGVMHQMQWFGECLKFHYSDFWDVLLSMLARLTAKASSDAETSQSS